MKGGEKRSLPSVHEEKIQELPASLPVMVLPGATLFPNALLPLFIFEEEFCNSLLRYLSATCRTNGATGG